MELCPQNKFVRCPSGIDRAALDGSYDSARQGLLFVILYLDAGVIFSSCATCCFTNSALGPLGKYVKQLRRCARAPVKSRLSARITASSCSVFGWVCRGSE